MSNSGQIMSSNTIVDVALAHALLPQWTAHPRAGEMIACRSMASALEVPVATTMLKVVLRGIAIYYTTISAVIKPTRRRDV